MRRVRWRCCDQRNGNDRAGYGDVYNTAVAVQCKILGGDTFEQAETEFDSDVAGKN